MQYDEPFTEEELHQQQSRPPRRFSGPVSLFSAAAPAPWPPLLMPHVAAPQPPPPPRSLQPQVIDDDILQALSREKPLTPRPSTVIAAGNVAGGIGRAGDAVGAERTRSTAGNGSNATNRGLNAGGNGSGASSHGPGSVESANSAAGDSGRAAGHPTAGGNGTVAGRPGTSFGGNRGSTAGGGSSAASHGASFGGGAEGDGNIILLAAVCFPADVLPPSRSPKFSKRTALKSCVQSCPILRRQQ